MARIRTIKPDFFASEDVAVLSLRARLTWIGIWVIVDDAGRFKDNARIIKGHVWPLDDDITPADVSNDLEELARAGRIYRYAVDGSRYLLVTNWTKHQAIPKASKPRHPAPPKISGETVTETMPQVDLPEDYRNVPVTLPSGKGKGRGEGNGKGEGKGDAPAPHPIPSDFAPTPEMIAWAQRETPAVSYQAVTQEFVTYWTNQGSPKQNWPAAWKSWMTRKHGEELKQGWKPNAASPWDAKGVHA